MSNIKNKSNIPRSSRTIRRSKLLWTAAVLSVVVLGGFSAAAVLRYQHDQAIAAERIRFEQADKDVQKVAQAIIAATGQPYKIQENKSCSRPSTKFEEAILFCNTSRTLFYSVRDVGAVVSLHEKINSSIKNIWQIKEIEVSDNISSLKEFRALDLANYDKLTSHQLINSKYFNDRAKIDCSASSLFYWTSVPPFEEYDLGQDVPYALSMDVSCGDKASMPYFPLRG